MGSMTPYVVGLQAALPSTVPTLLKTALKLQAFPFNDLPATASSSGASQVPPPAASGNPLAGPPGGAARLCAICAAPLSDHEALSAHERSLAGQGGGRGGPGFYGRALGLPMEEQRRRSGHEDAHPADSSPAACNGHARGEGPQSECHGRAMGASSEQLRPGGREQAWAAHSSPAAGDGPGAGGVCASKGAGGACGGGATLAPLDRDSDPLRQQHAFAAACCYACRQLILAPQTKGRVLPGVDAAASGGGGAEVGVCGLLPELLCGTQRAADGLRLPAAGEGASGQRRVPEQALRACVAEFLLDDA